MKNTHTNDFDPWSSIGFQTALILNRFRTERELSELLELAEENEEERDRKSGSADREKQREEDHRKYVEQRLREAAIWERRLNGK